MDKVTRLRRERRAEAVSNRGPSAYQPNALPLGQTGSQKEEEEEEEEEEESKFETCAT